MPRPTSVPRWASAALASVIAPAEGKKDIGFQVGERPRAQYFNWFFRLVYQWIAWLNAEAPAKSEHNVWTGLNEFDNVIKANGLDGAPHDDSPSIITTAAPTKRKPLWQIGSGMPGVFLRLYVTEYGYMEFVTGARWDSATETWISDGVYEAFRVRYSFSSVNEPDDPTILAFEKYEPQSEYGWLDEDWAKVFGVDQGGAFTSNVEGDYLAVFDGAAPNAAGQTVGVGINFRTRAEQAPSSYNLVIYNASSQPNINIFEAPKVTAVSDYGAYVTAVATAASSRTRFVYRLVINY